MTTEEFKTVDFEHRLKHHAIGKWHVLIQSVAFMAPAGALVVTTPLIILMVGYGAPLIFVISTISVLLVANTVAEFGKRMPTAGAFYTFNVAGFGLKGGFLTGWLMFVGYSLIPIGGMAYAAFWAQLLAKHYGVNLPFVVPFLAFTAGIFLLSYRGIRMSINFDATVIFIEVGVVTALALTALALSKAPAHVSTAEMFGSAAFPKFSAWVLAMVFGILAYVGFESGAALGEETKEPRKAIPFGTLWASLLVGTFYILWHWAVTASYGGQLVAKAAEAQPLQTLSDGNWGPRFFPLVAFVAMYGSLGFSIASHNTVTRAFYTMGREGILPRVLGRTHATFRTPAPAIMLQTVLELALGVPLGILVGGDFTWFYLGYIATLGLLLVYIGICISLMRVMLTRYRSEFSPIRHGVYPVLGAAMMLLVLGGSIYPVPPAPYNYLVYLLGGFIVIGYLVVSVVQRTRPEAVVRAGALLAGIEAE